LDDHGLFIFIQVGAVNNQLNNEIGPSNTLIFFFLNVRGQITSNRQVVNGSGETVQTFCVIKWDSISKTIFRVVSSVVRDMKNFEHFEL